MNNAPAPIRLTVSADPHLARLVRMTAANVAMLSSMSVDRVEDIRMAAEEAFIYACAAKPMEELPISFEVDDEHVAMTFELGDVAFDEISVDTETSVYADLILGAVCDSYEKRENPSALHLMLKADV